MLKRLLRALFLRKAKSCSDLCCHLLLLLVILNLQEIKLVRFSRSLLYKRAETGNTPQHLPATPTPIRACDELAERLCPLPELSISSGILADGILEAAQQRCNSHAVSLLDASENLLHKRAELLGRCLV
jgi:hypothetical protein